MKLIKEMANIPVKISEHHGINNSEGIIYVYGYDMSDTEGFKTGMKNDLDISDVEPATWIKSRNKLATALKVTFNKAIPPEYIEISGEQTHCKVYEIQPKPMRCVKCQDYGHTKKRCKKEKHICGKCNIEGHETNSCHSMVKPICQHCGDEHYTGNRSCSLYKYELEILMIQKNEQVGRAQAMILAQQRNISRTVNYARAARNERTTENKNPNAEKQTVNKTQENPQNTEIQADVELMDTISQNNRRRRSSTSDEEANILKNIKGTKDKSKIKKQKAVDASLGGHGSGAAVAQDDDTMHEDELTSQNNPDRRNEALKIFNEYPKAHVSTKKLQEILQTAKQIKENST